MARLRQDAGAVHDAFPDPWLRLYSMKANGLPGLVREIATQGFAVSAVSGGEIGLARRAGVAPARIVLEGIGKTDRDLALATRLAADKTPLLWVSVEGEEDAAALAAQAARFSSGNGARGRSRLDVLVRVNPQVAPETLNALAVGAPSSKFGVLPEELSAVIEAGGGPDGPLRWRGIHLHVGSQLGAVDAWRSSFRVGLRLLELQRATLKDFDTLDAGGGFPVAYDGEPDSVPSAARFAAEARAELAQIPAAARPRRLAIEPGRAVVAGCGWLIGRVLHVRHREPPIVVLDTGMTELLRPALYGAAHPMVALTSLGQPIDAADRDSADGAPATVTVRVDGPVCESTDTLGTAPLPAVERGDIMAIGMAGAYGSSMSSTYNGRPRPSEVAWDGGQLTFLRRRGSLRSLS
ncbi:MAG: diaminopimelate decarboxylase family protein [Candidatus Limnocylindrales bacterium]